MGILRAVVSGLGGSLSDQWKDLITVDSFDELTVLSPGYLKRTNNNRGSNVRNSNDVITNGSLIFVPENTAAVIYSQGFIENIVTKPGVFEYLNGEKSIFNGDDLLDTIFDQVKDRIRFGGISSQEKKIVFVNMRELRGILFGTKGPQIYHDKYYDADLEVIAHGSISIQIVDVEKFLKNFLPANVTYYTLDDTDSKSQSMSEFIMSFISILNEMSNEYKLSELPAKVKYICELMKNEKDNVGSWEERFGLKIVNIAVEHIAFTEKSKQLIEKYNESKMSMKAYEGVTQEASNIAAQQKMAEGIKEKGLGDGGAGVILGMNMAQGIAANMNNNGGKMDVAKQMEVLKNMKELLDAGLLTKEEFDLKKKEIMGV